MTTADDPAWVLVDACTLPSAEQPLRVAEFDDLFAETLTRVTLQEPTRVRLTMFGEPGLRSRVQSLVDRESECCSFFTFRVTACDADAATGQTLTGVHLDVEVPEARADVLSALAGRAEDVLATSGRAEPVGRTRS